MQRKSLAENLSVLEAKLNDLLSTFESHSLSDELDAGSSWSRVTRAFEDVRRELDEGGAGSEGHRSALERCLRLYAVATGMIARRREDLVVERRACVEARTRLREVRADSTSGSSCDLQA